MKNLVNSLYELINRICVISPEHLDMFAALSDDQFQEAFDALLGNKLDGMEKNKKNFQSLDETGLSAVLALAMSMPGLSATQEENSNGHTDLSFESYRFGFTRRILGEAKIYDGPQYHFEGLKQLLGYMTGRELRGLIVVYMRKANGSQLIQKVRDKMDIDMPEKQLGHTKNHILKWAFNSEHQHSCGDCVKVSHVACNLYVK